MSDDDDADFQKLLDLAEEAASGDEVLPTTCQADDGTTIPASDGETSEEEGFRNRSENPGEDADSQGPARKKRQLSKPGFQAVSGAAVADLFGTRPTKPAQQPSLPDCREKYSGINITKTLYPIVVLHERFAAISFLKLSQLRSRMSSPSPESSWATVGVLIQKSKPKEAKDGRTFSVWTLSDLSGATATVFLFGAAHHSYFTDQVGSVVAILNGKVRSQEGKFDISLDTKEQLIKLGFSKDLGFCKGRKKDGQTCKAAIDKSKCSYCDHHVQSELKKMSSKRAQLRGHSLKTAFRGNGKAINQGASRPAQYLPLKNKSREELLDVAQAQSDQKKFSMGARYIKRMADPPSQDGYVDPDVPRGVGVYNPSNRIGSQLPTRLVPQENSQQAKADTLSGKERVRSQVAAPVERAAPQLHRGRTSRAAHMHAVLGETYDKPRTVPPADLSQQSQQVVERSNTARGQDQEAAKASSRIVRPPKGQPPQATASARGEPSGQPQSKSSIAREKGPSPLERPAVRAGQRKTHGNASRAEKPEVQPRHSSTKQPDSGPNQLGLQSIQKTLGPRQQSLDSCQPGSQSSQGGFGSCQRNSKPGSKDMQDGEEPDDEILLDDELDMEPRGGSSQPPSDAGPGKQPLMECDIDWGPKSATGSMSRQPKGEQPTAIPAKKGEAQGQTKKRALSSNPLQPKNTRLMTVHRQCVFDEDQGGMVEVGHGDEEWLNGRDEMPHQRRASFGRSSCTPAGLATAIQQVSPSVLLKESKAAQQADADAQARLRAVNIFKMRPLSAGSAGKAGTGVGASPLKRKADPSEEGVSSDAKPGKLKPDAPSFYGAAAKVKAKQAYRSYDRVLKSGARSSEAVSDFTMAFASVLEDAPTDDQGSRYRSFVMEEEDAKLDSVMMTLQTKDELSQKAEAITKLSVTAFQCKTCNCLSERRRPSCRDHDVQRVSTTKRWWVCACCTHHFATVGVRLPKSHCPKCPSTSFTASAMRRPKRQAADPSSSHACKENLVATTEQAYNQVAGSKAALPQA